MSDLIALSGYARSGKDTVAKLLAASHTRVAFADSLREVALALDPMVDCSGIPKRLAILVATYGWEECKDAYPDVRRLLQRLGTEVGRTYFGENVWVDMALRKIAGPSVFTDCRFPNEADAVRDLGGQVWRIQRPGYGPVNGHASEHALDDYPFDVVIDNDGDLHDLARQVRHELSAAAR